MRYAVTGHQPPLLGGFGDDAQAAVRAFASDWVRVHRPAKVISGMAPGWDMAMAFAAVANDVPLIAALAFPEQGRDWPDHARQEMDYLLAMAEYVHCHSNEKHRGCWTLRDRWVLEQGEAVVALWSGADGGTAKAIESALAMGLPVANLWDEWTGWVLTSGEAAA